MAENRTDKTTAPAKPAPSAGTVLWDGVKLGLSEAADLASLRMKAASLERKRDSLFTKLGRVTYLKQHPAQGSVRSELDEEAAAVTAELHDTIAELTELRLKIKLRKAGVGK